MKRDEFPADKILAAWCWTRVNGQIEYYIVDTYAKCWISHDMGEHYALIGDYIAGTLGLSKVKEKSNE